MISRADDGVALPALGVLESLEFAALYVYSPAGVTSTSHRSRLLRELVKRAYAPLIERAARRIGEVFAEPPFFADTCVLVPVPGSEPTVDPARGVPGRIARQLAQQGLGTAIWPGIRRARPVNKSGTAAPGDRPTCHEHCATFAVDTTGCPRERLVLVDDVVTKGRTLLAAATCLTRVYPDAVVSGFALLRTMGMAGEVRRLCEPCRGVIRWHRGDAWRRP